MDEDRQMASLTDRETVSEGVGMWNSSVEVRYLELEFRFSMETMDVMLGPWLTAQKPTEFSV